MNGFYILETQSCPLRLDRMVQQELLCPLEKLQIQTSISQFCFRLREYYVVSVCVSLWLTLHIYGSDGRVLASISIIGLTEKPPVNFCSCGGKFVLKSNCFHLLAINFVPSVVVHLWIWVGAAGQNHQTALQYWTRTTDWCVVWRVWKEVRNVKYKSSTYTCWLGVFDNSNYSSFYIPIPTHY